MTLDTYIGIAALGGSIAILLGAYFAGRIDGRDRLRADTAERELRAVRKVRDAAREAPQDRGELEKAMKDGDY